MTPYTDRLKAGEYTDPKDKVEGKRKNSSTTTETLSGITTHTQTHTLDGEQIAKAMTKARAK